MARYLQVRIAHEVLSELQGQTVVLDEENKLLFHWIKEGPYLTAGRRYGWRGPGIGVNESILRSALEQGCKICILLADKLDRYYQARQDPQSLINLAEKHKSIERRGNAKIYIIPFKRDHFETRYDIKLIQEVVKHFDQA